MTLHFYVAGTVKALLRITRDLFCLILALCFAIASIVAWCFEISFLFTGTPGTGKSSLSKELTERTGFQWLEVSKLAKDWGCLSGFDEEYQCSVLDEDKVCHISLLILIFLFVPTFAYKIILLSQLLDTLEPIMALGGKIIDYHGCEFFPERWFDIVFVLRTNNTILYDRLQER